MEETHNIFPFPPGLRHQTLRGWECRNLGPWCQAILERGQYSI